MRAYSELSMNFLRHTMRSNLLVGKNMEMYVSSLHIIIEYEEAE